MLLQQLAGDMRGLSLTLLDPSGRIVSRNGFATLLGESGGNIHVCLCAVYLLDGEKCMLTFLTGDISGQIFPWRSLSIKQLLSQITFTQPCDSSDPHGLIRFEDVASRVNFVLLFFGVILKESSDEVMPTMPVYFSLLSAYYKLRTLGHSVEVIYMPLDKKGGRCASFARMLPWLVAPLDAPSVSLQILSALCGMLIICTHTHALALTHTPTYTCTQLYLSV